MIDIHRHPFPRAAILAFGITVAGAFHASAAPSAQVRIQNFAFVPAVVTVAPGTIVTWVNADEDPHSVNAVDKSFRSAALDTNDRFAFTFAKPGDYAYFCSLHPHMTGRIVVKAP